MITHILIFLFSAAVIWFFSGILVDSTSKIARRFHKSGFAVAFLVLGLLTSIGEISVAVNSVAGGVPQISAGNLVGASLVIFFLIIPVLAIFGRGIKLDHSLRKRDVLLALGVIMLPSVFMIDGNVGVKDGFLMVMLYTALLFHIMTRKGVEKAVDELEDAYIDKLRDGFFDIAKVCVGGAIIFFSSHLLVEEAQYFSIAFGVPASFIGLLLLSIGTNVPELVIAIRSVLGGRKEIAFGDYLGSASANTLIMGAMSVGAGPFAIARSEFLITSAILGIGLMLFFFFSNSGRELSRREGIALFLMYVLFVILQIAFVPTGNSTT